jgi:hypothetical protein
MLAGFSDRQATGILTSHPRPALFHRLFPVPLASQEQKLLVGPLEELLLQALLVQHQHLKFPATPW